ncbi:MAG: aspartate/glutamate racemase family protein [Phycisphaerae bacterium]|nr:aspartate/glutamate racemase family protein [Phycisphaerae bacterium]
MSTQREASSLIEIVGRGKSELFTVSFDRYATEVQELPIGVFDSGIGGLTVLAAILQMDTFNNVTHELGPDGRPDFEHEHFIYLGDQANMPYGNYPTEQKTDFLRELIIKDVVFLVGGRYWPYATAQMPRHDKPPVKAIVIACNTATAYGLESISAALKEWQLPVQVVGIVDAGAGGAVRAITEQSSKGAVAVLATVGTCSSEGYIHAIAQKASKAGIVPPTVIQQGCLGLAGAVESDPSYISLAEVAQAVDYRGPAVGNQIAPIDPGLLGQYNFEADGLLGDVDRPDTWRLNSVENYIRYHTASLMESYRRSGDSEPISTVVLACTHFPYYSDEIAESLGRLRDFRAADGAEPYKSLILERPSFIDPAELTGRQLYETLARSGLLIEGQDESVSCVDEFYVSVPNTWLPGVKLAEAGGFTYEYKYGRDPGHFEWEYVRRVPMSSVNLSQAVREMIKKRMPAVWNRLVVFSQRSPRTMDVPDSASIVPSTGN